MISRIDLKREGDVQAAAGIMQGHHQLQLRTSYVPTPSNRNLSKITNRRSQCVMYEASTYKLRRALVFCVPTLTPEFCDLIFEEDEN
jgi:hypothetical protein